MLVNNDGALGGGGLNERLEVAARVEGPCLDDELHLWMELVLTTRVSVGRRRLASELHRLIGTYENNRCQHQKKRAVKRASGSGAPNSEK